MRVLRDEARIRRLQQVGRAFNLVGITALALGMVVAVVSLFSGPDARFLGSVDLETVFLLQFGALLVGWICSQIGMYLAHRYLRSPRPDEVLDNALRKVARDGRLYHYLLPAPHVLLTKTGVIVVNAKYQTGRIRAEGDKWNQAGVGFRRFFGQEGLGNPTREVEGMVKAVADYIHKQAPQLEEVPIAPMIVFTTKNIPVLDVKASRIPAMHASKVKGFLRRLRGQAADMAPADYAALKAAFDKQAEHLIGADDGHE